ncbi:MAG TPA: hypothetical protein VMS60_15005 [Solirubrobacterales bacterium]|nr:hypothetical protein [Solirubrobacterales bacterium]
MAVMAREAWTDERLDDLKETVDAGFAEMRAEFKDLRVGLKDMRDESRRESRELRAEFKEGMREMRVEFQQEMRELRTTTGETQRLVFQTAAAIWITTLVGFLGVLATILTKV